MQAADIVELLLRTLREGETYAERRGASFGLAGVVGGLGLGSLKQHGIMAALEEAASSKKNPQAKQGAFFALENLCRSLGRLFEPYVIRTLPLLLKAYGDANRHVREAAQAASRAVMAILTGHGVKLVMPSILKGLQEVQWRSKQASIVMLGSMAYCAPTQLSRCLPQIVPRLVEAFADAHPKVQAAGRTALQVQ